MSICGLCSRNVKKVSQYKYKKWKSRKTIKTENEKQILNNFLIAWNQAIPIGFAKERKFQKDLAEKKKQLCKKRKAKFQNFQGQMGLESILLTSKIYQEITSDLIGSMVQCSNENLKKIKQILEECYDLFYIKMEFMKSYVSSSSYYYHKMMVYVMRNFPIHFSHCDALFFYLLKRNQFNDALYHYYHENMFNIFRTYCYNQPCNDDMFQNVYFNWLDTEKEQFDMVLQKEIKNIWQYLYLVDCPLPFCAFNASKQWRDILLENPSLQNDDNMYRVYQIEKGVNDFLTTRASIMQKFY